MNWSAVISKGVERMQNKEVKIGISMIFYMTGGEEKTEGRRQKAKGKEKGKRKKYFMTNPRLQSGGCSPVHHD